MTTSPSGNGGPTGTGRMGITVAGKGGTGKTVIAAVLARSLARRGRRVLAVDLDSNPMLAISLGVNRRSAPEPAPIPTDFWVAVERPGTGTAAVLQERPEVLIERHGLRAPDGVTLLTGPVVENEGCTSDAGVRGMLGVLLGRHSFDRVITDFEAGVDEPAWALGGILNPADVLLIVTTPSPVALETGLKVARIAAEAEIPRIQVIANQVRDEGDRERIVEAFAARGVGCAAVVAFDENIAAADVHGRSPIDMESGSPGLAALTALAQRLDESAPSG